APPEGPGPRCARGRSGSPTATPTSTAPGRGSPTRSRSWPRASIPRPSPTSPARTRERSCALPDLESPEELAQLGVELLRLLEHRVVPDVLDDHGVEVGVAPVPLDLGHAPDRRAHRGVDAAHRHVHAEQEGPEV